MRHNISPRGTYFKAMVNYAFALLIVIPLTIQAAEYPILWNVNYHNKNFEGRDLILQQISKFFNNGEDIVSLAGMGGIGKTQITKKFAEDYKGDFDSALENLRMSLVKTEETGEEISLGGKLPALLMQADLLAKKGKYKEAEKIFDSIFIERQVDDLSQLYSALAKNNFRLKDGDLAKDYLHLT